MGSVQDRCLVEGLSGTRDGKAGPRRKGGVIEGIGSGGKDRSEEREFHL